MENKDSENKKKYNLKRGEGLKLINTAINGKLKRSDKIELQDDPNKDYVMVNGLRVPKSKLENDIKSQKLIKAPKGIGSLSGDDLASLSVVLGATSKISNTAIDKITNLTQDKKHLGKLNEELVIYKDVLNDALDRVERYAQDEIDLNRTIKETERDLEVVQAARDGILVKTIKRTDENGNTILQDISMDEFEVRDILKEYEIDAERAKESKITSYAEAGLSLYSAWGTIYNCITGNRKALTKNLVYVLVSVGAETVKGLCNEDARKEMLKDIDSNLKSNRMHSDLLENEQISEVSQEKGVEELELELKKGKDASASYENKRFTGAMLNDLANAMLIGVGVSHKRTQDGKSKLSMEDFINVLRDVGKYTGLGKGIVDSVFDLSHVKSNDDEFHELELKYKDIMSQMNEKVYPLVEPTDQDFDSLKIENLDAKFYPKKDYKTGDISYGAEIYINEFSASKGEVILLTGDSGAGKSTFLRLLERGDINNRSCIKLLKDGKDVETVDKLGTNYVGLNTGIKLGGSTTVFHQITGKDSINDIDGSKQDQLLTIFKSLKLVDETGLDDKEILDENAKVLQDKAYNEFSLGQKERINLIKAFYTLDTNVNDSNAKDSDSKDISPSVLILDEVVR